MTAANTPLNEKKDIGVEELEIGDKLDLQNKQFWSKDLIEESLEKLWENYADLDFLLTLLLIISLLVFILMSLSLFNRESSSRNVISFLELFKNLSSKEQQLILQVLTEVAD